MLENLTTEKRNEFSMSLDELSIEDAITLLNNEDYHVLEAIAAQKEEIAEMIRTVVSRMEEGGRLFYLGAGTSGRLGILDAAECVPTFSTDPELVQGIIAGGEVAVTQAVEGAEDSLTLAEEDLMARQLSPKDILIGISASGRTPYVIGGLTYARKIGVTTGAISCNSNAEMSHYADHAIELAVGPEVLTGSTRMKAGTAQKLVLNAISTITMVQLGKVYQNLMIDVKPTNEKLIERSKRIIMDATDVSYEVAESYFERANQKVKLAITMILTGYEANEAESLLAEHKGHIRKAIGHQHV
ncbi:N-acetylmuramic acid 6-phosphate etherase [Enterococcus canis]|uniref:N-acetylmuramic acid 6-phosphate etherase n=1 Tax=Enterococcus canis TaxID=214095 RepID=A0A1L8RD33_9ENTE|nr:N-acetylmuramic acid 6-phosphate etherase [Enterococcus canis]OJG17592.1 N-acetylmuramic acid 6-phosphate etherase [Enterococcus canis]